MSEIEEETENDPKKLLIIRILPELKDRLQHIARKRGQTMTNLVITACIDYYGLDKEDA